MGEFLAVPDWHHRRVKALAPARRSNFMLWREIIASEKPDLMSGIVKSAVADPGDVLAGMCPKCGHKHEILSL